MAGCDVGQQAGSGNHCYACPVGSYNTEFNSSCERCPPNTVSPEGATSSAQCGKRLHSSLIFIKVIKDYRITQNHLIKSEDTWWSTKKRFAHCYFSCVEKECFAGYYLDGDVCTECSKGEWKLAGNSTSCNSCPGNMTTLSNATQSEADCGKCQKNWNCPFSGLARNLNFFNSKFWGSWRAKSTLAYLCEDSGSELQLVSFEFFLNNTNLTFLAVLYKIDIKGFQNQQK